MKAIRAILVAMVVVLIGVGAASSAYASKIVNMNDKLVCSECYKNDDIPVEGAQPPSFYRGVIETEHFAFIQEDSGTSCNGGGWSIIDKRVPNPGLVPVETECKEITAAKAFESNGNVYFKVTYYGKSPVVYQFKM